MTPLFLVLAQAPDMTPAEIGVWVELARKYAGDSILLLAGLAGGGMFLLFWRMRKPEREAERAHEVKVAELRAKEAEAQRAAAASYGTLASKLEDSLRLVEALQASEHRQIDRLTDLANRAERRGG